MGNPPASTAGTIPALQLSCAGFGEQRERGRQQPWIAERRRAFHCAPADHRSLSPNAGDPGTSVVIAGSSFVPRKAAWAFNGVAAVVSPGATRALPPRRRWARARKRGRHQCGKPASNGVGFNMTDNLAVTLFAPTTGPAGTSVTITGGGFGANAGDQRVRFNGGTPAAITSWSENQIVAVVPSNTSTGPVSVTVSERRPRALRNLRSI